MLMNTARSDNMQLSITIIAQEPWMPNKLRHVSGAGPDPNGIYRVMEEKGIFIDILDPLDGPWNLFGRAHPIFRSLDPIRAAKIIAKQRKCHLLISVFPSSLVSTLILRQFVRHRVPIAVWDVAPSESWRLGRMIDNFVLPRVNHFFLLSSHQEKYIKHHWNRDANFYNVGQHVDTEFFYPSEVNSSSDYVLSVGDDAGRDFETLAEAVSLMDSQSAKFILRTKREIMAPEWMMSRITLLKERVPFEQLRSLYQMSQFVVVPLHRSRNVSGVGTVLEAMATGKGLIVSDSPTIRDYVVPNKTAIVVEPNNAKELASAIIHLQKNPDISSRLGMHARQFVLDNYSHRTFGVRMAAAIRHAVG